MLGADVGNNEASVYEYYSYDTLVRISQGDTEIENTYDGESRNIYRKTNGKAKLFVYDGNTVIYETGMGGAAARNVYGVNLISRTVSGATALYGYNGHGDVISVLDCFENTVHSYDYNEFGKQKESAENLFLPRYGMKADTNPFRYCGEYFDEETGFVYLRARYYSPDTGRFVSEDPIKDGNNWYVYCGNNPICFFDNSGYCYYDKNGNWSHDNWEFSGNYVRREDPIKEYIDGNIDEDDKCFQKAMEWWNEHGLYSSISHYGIINNIDYDCFDKEILAFSNYWNHALGISSIDPDVVKSMLVIESNMGNSKSNYKDNDPAKDVMQALDPRNPNISLLSKIGGDPNEGVLYGIPKSGYGAIRNLYSGGTPIMSKVTPMLSICFGTRSLGYFIELRGSVNEGIARYNGYGDKDYLSKVTACMASPATWIRENR